MKIVYKAVAAILALSVIPAAIFIPIFDCCFNAPLLTLLEPGKQYVADSISIYSIYETLSMFSDGIGSSDKLENFKMFINPALVAVVFFVLIMVFAILTAVLAAVCKKKTPACFAAIFGIMFTYIFTAAFDLLVKPFADGSASLASLFGSMILAFVADVEYIRLSSGYFIIYMPFILVLIWAVVFSLTEPKDAAKSSYTEER